MSGSSTQGMPLALTEWAWVHFALRVEVLCKIESEVNELV